MLDSRRPRLRPQDLHLDVALGGTKDLGAWSDGRVEGKTLERPS